ncbi:MULTISPECIES: acetoacetate decarboxylase family protein [Streptomyces]|uniref:acetoacetate decarboxylase family protein n=1 Tax=Streptomyces TaxID=1883 RepID=UPI00067E26BA|nr:MULTISPECIES: acetoacetate decarboxylase family protein [Streptomyces]
MNAPEEVPGTGPVPGPYPPPPWHLKGHLWGGLFPAESVPAPPPDLSRLLPRTLAVFLIRYRAGTLRYDELIVGTPARRGRRAGLYIQWIWVDDERSLWGGRRIWGVPKRLAEFRWDGSRVRVTDGEGPVAVLDVTTKPPSLPRLPLPMTGFGSLDGARTVATARFSARPAAASLRVAEWSARLPALRRADARIRFAATSFDMLMPAPARYPAPATT